MTTDAKIHRWWSLFQDPVLDALIARAATANLDLRIAETRVREARAQRRLTVATGLPSLNVGGSNSNSRRSENISTGGSSQNLFQADFDAEWELDILRGGFYVQNDKSAYAGTGDAAMRAFR